MMTRILAGVLFMAVAASGAMAASALRHAPAYALSDAPEEYTQFSPEELEKGFMALAFGSDLRVGKGAQVVKRFTQPVRVHVAASASADQIKTFQDALMLFRDAVPNLQLTVTENASDANVSVHLIAEKDLEGSLAVIIGASAAKNLIARTDAQCMTNVTTNERGEILHADSFIIVDQGEDAFRDCAYHEMLHVFGLSSHDQSNMFTTLNQDRLVGYLTIYDRSLLTLLYDPRMKAGTSKDDARKLLPELIRDLKPVTE